MLLPDETNQNSETPERSTRPPLNYKDVIREHRQNTLEDPNTDELPRLMGEQSNEQMAWRQVGQLREENHRLRSELAAYDKNIETLHTSHRQEVEQYQHHLRELMEERNQLQEAYSVLEYNHQELYQSFVNTVEEETNKRVADELRTVEFSAQSRSEFSVGSGNSSPLTHDEMKTVEFHVRQLEDRHTAEALYLMRQTQRKAKRLESQLAQERQHIMEERQKLAQERNSVRDQALLRQRLLETRLRAKWTSALTLIAGLLLILFPLFQLVFLSAFHIHVTLQLLLSLLLPLFICFVIAGLFAHFRSRVSTVYKGAPHKHKAPEKAKETAKKGA